MKNHSMGAVIFFLFIVIFLDLTPFTPVYFDESVLALSMLALLYSFFIETNSKEKRQRFRSLLTKKFLVEIFFIITWSIVVFYNDLNENNPEKKGEAHRRIIATRDAMMAFIIAILAYLEWTTAPFWIVWLISYFLYFKTTKINR